MTLRSRQRCWFLLSGSYDLSIRDRKFAGISQRRIRGGVAVKFIFVLSGSERATLVRDFYNLAIQGEETRFTYPEIVPSTMASLSELLNETITVQDLMMRLLKHCNNSLQS